MLSAGSLLEQFPNNLPRIFIKGEFGQMIGLSIQLSCDMNERNWMKVVDDASSLDNPMLKIQVVQGVLVHCPIDNCFGIPKDHNREQIQFPGKVEKALESYELSLCIGATPSRQFHMVGSVFVDS